MARRNHVGKLAADRPDGTSADSRHESHIFHDADARGILHRPRFTHRGCEAQALDVARMGRCRGSLSHQGARGAGPPGADAPRVLDRATAVVDLAPALDCERPDVLSAADTALDAAHAARGATVLRLLHRARTLRALSHDGLRSLRAVVVLSRSARTRLSAVDDTHSACAAHRLAPVDDRRRLRCATLSVDLERERLHVLFSVGLQARCLISCRCFPQWRY